MYTGDVIVADSDEVVVVQRRDAVRVVQIAYQELVDDMKGHKDLYVKIGRKLNQNVVIREEPTEFFKRLGLPPNPNQPSK